MSTNFGHLYNIRGWGEPYFTVNSKGNISVKINGVETNPKQEIDLYEAIQGAIQSASSGFLQFPLIVRFPDVLKHRLQSLNAAFEKAIKYKGYNSHYQGVFPVKVNQNRVVVEDLVRFGKDYAFGLEAGSKPELLLAMKCLINGSPDAFLVCNGYKDADYIKLALMARAIKLNTIIVLEMQDELDTVIAASKQLGVKPVIGIRAKLLTTNPGHFGSTSGKHGKFGFLEEEIYTVANRLKTAGMLDCLELLHFHIGSQIPTISKVEEAVREAVGYYCNLVKMGAPMGKLDVGGGLGIDYDGTRSANSDMSVEYDIEEYAAAVVQAARFECDLNGVAHPVLCSESGRALVSHHSVQIFEALSSVEEPSDSLDSQQLMEKIGRLVGNQMTLHSNIRSSFAARHESSLTHALDLKKHGVEIFKLSKRLLKKLYAGEETTYNYHMNLSVFSLTPDFWGIKQLFPTTPIHRLNEKPAKKGTLVDLTCDSDGKIDQFIGGAQTLPLHDLNGHSYYVGIFLAGAYQEALGNRHNLFGGPTITRVESDGSSGFKITMLDSGTTAADSLKNFMHDPRVMYAAIGERAKEEGHWASFEQELLTRVFGTMPYLFPEVKVAPLTNDNK